MTRRSKRMNIVLMLALQKEQEAGKQLREYLTIYHQECNQLAELQDYKSHYLKAYTQAQSELQTEQMIRYSELIIRLRETLIEQEGKIKDMAKNVQQLRMYWHIIHQKKQAVNDMIERMKKGEAHESESHLQKELDDLAQNKPKY